MTKSLALDPHDPSSRGDLHVLSVRSRPEYNGARRKNANVAEVEAMIQMLLQVLHTRVPPPHVITVFDSMYAYKKVTGTAPVNKNGALVGVAAAGGRTCSSMQADREAKALAGGRPSLTWIHPSSGKSTRVLNSSPSGIIHHLVT
eukprot:COSAG01_NODE_15330_length_1348_cov_4.162530_1_plen_145_part_00